MSKRVPVSLTGYELRVLHDVLSLVLNDPDWQDMASMTGRDWAALGRAHDRIMNGWHTAAKAASTPAGTLGVGA